MGMAYYNNGLVNLKKHRYRKAIENLQKAIEINPKDSDAFYNIGIAYAKIENYDKANTCMLQAARLGHKKTQDLLRENGISW